MSINATKTVAELALDDLDGHTAVQPGVARAVDFAHPTLADTGGDLVGAQASPSMKRHGGLDYILRCPWPQRLVSQRLVSQQSGHHPTGLTTDHFVQFARSTDNR